MSIPQSLQPVIRTNPAEASPEAQAPAVSKPTGRHIDTDTPLASMTIESVPNLVEIYRGNKNPEQAPVRQKNLLQTIYTEYKNPVNDMLTFLGGVSPASVRPLVGAFKSILLGTAGIDSRMNGHKFNLFSGPANALGGAFASLLSSALFFKGSTLKTGADVLLKNIQTGIKNPKIAPFFRFDPSSVGKSLVAISMSKIVGTLTANLTTQRPEDAGTQMTETDQKYANRLYIGMAFLYVQQALIGIPAVKEGLANFIPKFKSEKFYDEMVKKEASTTNAIDLEVLRAAKPAALLLAERAKSVRIDIPQQIHALGAAGILAAVTYVLFNAADKKNSDNYVRQHNNQ